MKFFYDKDQIFFSNALPVTEADNGPGNSSGYKVITVALNWGFFIFLSID